MIKDRLKTAREKMGFSQTDVARLLNTTRQAYNHYETGRREPTLDTLDRLAEILHTSTDFLMGRTEKKEPAADDGDKLNPNTVVFCDKDGEKQVLQYSEEQMRKLNRILASTKKESISEYEEIIDRVNQLSPSNLSKLSELIDLYLNAQDNKG